MTNRLLTTTVTALAAAFLLLAVALSGSAPSGPSGRARGFSEELQEQHEVTELRLAALEAALAAGEVGIIEDVHRAPAPGWAGQELMNRTGNDWEPAIATDPNEPWVYVAYNRWGGPDACGNCPDPAMILERSSDGGLTWKRERYLCVCRGVGGQHDPLLEIVPATGDVYAAWMNNFQIHFSSSSDHGRNWTDPVHLHPDVRWGDKPNMAVSPDGQDVYVLFNGPTGGDVYAAYSHDGGARFTTIRLNNQKRYYFDYGGIVLPGGRVVFGQISFDYTGEGAAPVGPVRIHVFSSNDEGATWEDLEVDRVAVGTECESRACYPDYYDSGPVLAADTDGDLVIVYNGAAERHGPRSVFARSSKNGGRTWSDRVRISRTGANATYPAAVGEGDDTARVWFMDERDGRWNVRYRVTTDLGATWSKALRISDALSGTNYKNRRGFLEPYGDYGEIAITSLGTTVAVWGEGVSYYGPGGIWFNREL